MLSGGFNWIALGWIVDLILEWKPTAMDAITDEVSSCAHTHHAHVFTQCCFLLLLAASCC